MKGGYNMLKIWIKPELQTYLTEELVANISANARTNGGTVSCCGCACDQDPCSFVSCLA